MRGLGNGQVVSLGHVSGSSPGYNTIHFFNIFNQFYNERNLRFVFTVQQVLLIFFNFTNVMALRTFKLRIHDIPW